MNTTTLRQGVLLLALIFSVQFSTPAAKADCTVPAFIQNIHFTEVGEWQCWDSWVPVWYPEYGWEMELCSDCECWFQHQGWWADYTIQIPDTQPGPHQITVNYYFGGQETWTHQSSGGTQQIYLSYFANDLGAVTSFEVTGPCASGGGSQLVQGLGVNTSSGLNFNPTSDSAYTLFNYGGESMTLQARDAAGNVLGSQVQWHVTDLINDTVTHDWLTQPSITFNDLWGKALMIESRSSGSFSGFKFELSFAEDDYGIGADGNPYKVRRADNSFPYGAERMASCVLGALRNVLHIKGKPVPTEDAMVAILIQNGKPESDLGDDNIGITVGQTEGLSNLLIGPDGLTVTRHNSITADEVRDKLNNGAVLMVRVTINVGDFRDPNNPPREIGHIIVVHKVGNKIQVIDPGDGTKKWTTVDAVLKRIAFGGGPPAVTGRVWEVTP